MADINSLVECEFISNVNDRDKRMMEHSFWVRNTTLDYCYSIPEYKYMDKELQLSIYDTIHEIVERLGSTYLTIERLEARNDNDKGSNAI